MTPADSPIHFQTPANLRILFHLPPQSRGFTGKVNGIFLYTTRYGRIDKLGRHSVEPNMGMHVFEGRLLTVEEFMSDRVQKFMQADVPVKPLVRVCMISDGDATAENTTEMEGDKTKAPTAEEVALLLQNTDQLRYELSAKNQRIDELEAENSTFRQALQTLETQIKSSNEEAPAKAVKPEKAAKAE